MSFPPKTPPGKKFPKANGAPTNKNMRDQQDAPNDKNQDDLPMGAKTADQMNMNDADKKGGPKKAPPKSMKEAVSQSLKPSEESRKRASKVAMQTDAC